MRFVSMHRKIPVRISREEIKTKNFLLLFISNCQRRIADQIFPIPSITTGFSISDLKVFKNSEPVAPSTTR